MHAHPSMESQVKNNTSAVSGESRTSDAIDTPQVVHVRIEAINRGQKTQARAKTSTATVKEYAQALAEGAVMPPVDLFKDGRRYWIGDGHHRIAAMDRLSFDRVQANVRNGGWRSALLHSIKSNHSHGLRRTNADKRRAVMLLLKDQEWVQCSNGVISRIAGVSAPFVGKLRREAIDLGEIERRNKIRTSNGKLRLAHPPPPSSTANRHYTAEEMAVMPPLPAHDSSWRRAALLLAPPEGLNWPGLDFLPRHASMGNCPEADQPDARDPDCPACAALLAIECAGT